MKPRVEIMSEIPDKINFLEEFEKYDTELFVHKKMKTDKELAKQVLPMIKEVLEKIPAENYTHDILHDALIGLAAEKGLKNGQVLWTARVALTGKDVTPGGAIEMAEILGKEESLRRITFSQNLLEE